MIDWAMERKSEPLALAWLMTMFGELMLLVAVDEPDGVGAAFESGEFFE